MMEMWGEVCDVGGGRFCSVCRAAGIQQDLLEDQPMRKMRFPQHTRVLMAAEASGNTPWSHLEGTAANPSPSSVSEGLY